MEGGRTERMCRGKPISMSSAGKSRSIWAVRGGGVAWKSRCSRSCASSPPTWYTPCVRSASTWQTCSDAPTPTTLTRMPWSARSRMVWWMSPESTVWVEP